MDPDNLRVVPLFASMTEADVRRIATFASEDSVAAGATLMREGDYSNELVAIESGAADVLQGGEKVATLGPGDIFGEVGVLRRERRNASIVARAPMRLIRLTTFDVKRLPQETRDRLSDLVERRRPPDPTGAASGDA
jgi:CRP-like cAMP-binding protein